MKKLSNTEAELKKVIMLCHACLKQKLHNKDYITKLPYHMLGKHSGTRALEGFYLADSGCM